MKGECAELRMQLEALERPSTEIERIKARMEQSC
jgi:hypothetical protein